MEVQQREAGGLRWDFLPLELRHEAMDHDFRTTILPLVRKNWNPDSVKRVAFTEGVTNSLVGYYEKDVEEDMVLLRLNGEGTEIIIDRQLEMVSMLALHRAGLATPLYLEVVNGLCYGYVPGRSFTVRELQDDAMIRRTTRTLARLHSVPVPDILRGSKPLVWAKIDHCLQIATGDFPEPHRKERFKEVIGSMELLRQAVKSLNTELSHSSSALGFCHNDLLCGNCIYNEKDDTVSVIDFEYCGYNYFAYDIGNHFNEFAGIETVDYSKYPSEEVQKKWIRCYLEETALINGQDPATVSTEAIQQLYCEANKFALVSHLFWCVWSLVQAANSTIYFDFAEYANIRYLEYKRQKEHFLSLTA